jgi:hypothetical protein
MGFFSSSKKSTGIFIPDGGSYRELADIIENTSIIGVAALLLQAFLRCRTGSSLVPRV